MPFNIHGQKWDHAKNYRLKILQSVILIDKFRYILKSVAIIYYKLYTDFKGHC